MKKQFLIILWRLLKLVFPSIDLSILRPYFKLVYKLIKNHGTLHTIRYLKRVRLHCTRYICGHPLYTNEMSIGIDKEGWPKILIFLKPFVNHNLQSLKFLMTILNFTRSWKLSHKEWDKVKPDYKSITDPPKVNHIIPSGIINKFVKEYRLKSNHPTFEKKDDMFLSSKAGPNGPATLSCREDLLNFDYPMMDNILKITDQNGGDFFCNNYSSAFKENILPSRVKTLGKISFVKDPEAKLRIIAISDYFSQLYLKKIHDNIMNKLHNIPCDRTYTQDPQHSWRMMNNEEFWSLDLSSATDRFPVELQKRLLARIYDMKLAQSWQSILSSRSFTCPNGSTVKYNTGQPMGTYSSWCVFTLTHHLVVYYCAQLNGLSNFDQYIILGDDIVIKNNAVAKTYKDIIRKLGVEISEQKSHVSKDTYEFAKRWIQPMKNREITGLPLNGILNNFNNPNIVFTILYDYFKIKKNPIFMDSYSLVSLVKSLYFKIKIYDNKSKRTRYYNLDSKVIKSLKSFSLMLDIIFDYYSYDKIRNLLSLSITSPDYMIPNEGEALSELERILSMGLTKRLLQMVPKIIMDPKPLIQKFGIDEKDRNVLKDNPVFLAIYCQINKLRKIQIDDLSSIRNISKELVDLNIDSIFNKERNKIQSLIEIGKILKMGINKINNTKEVYYGSAFITDSYTFNGIQGIIKKNLNIQLLDQIAEGTYKPPVSYASLWENFKM